MVAPLTLGALAVTLLAAGPLRPAVAAADPAITTPEIRAGAVTVPSVTVPSVTVPSVTTPPLDVPSVSTPSVTTPATQTPPVEPPRVPAPAPSLPDSRAEPRAPTASRVPDGSQAPAAVPTASAPAARNPALARRIGTSAPHRAHRAASARQERRADAASRTPRPATTPIALRRPVARRVLATSSDAQYGPRGQRGVPAVGLAGPSRGSVLPGPVDEIVDALPNWVLGVFLGFALIAMLMAVNAYLNARRARTLGAQRAALLDDVGLLQTALLAPVPAHAGDAQVSVAYRPAAGPAAGGDFYDVIALSPGRTGLLLGDVSGHGREALRHAALVRYTVRTFLAAGHDPGDALARADDCLHADLDGHFATVIAGVYDHEEHTLRYARAGHHPPVVLGTTHDPDAEPVAPPLGAGLGIRPEASELTLDAGTTVCLFTDGLIEARRDGALLGRETLVDLLGQGRPDGPALLDRVVAHADEVSDDLAVCVLRRPDRCG